MYALIFDFGDTMTSVPCKDSISQQSDQSLHWMLCGLDTKTRIQRKQTLITQDCADVQANLSLSWEHM